ncbi:MAG: hypothetical protein ACI85Q_000511 [Salibacteraceae bacterium]|jgi:hypothetical protein
MKKIYLLALGVVASAASFAQTNSSAVLNAKHITGEVLPIRSENVTEARGTSTCIDTVDYAVYRALNGSNQITYFAVPAKDDMTENKGVGLFFPNAGSQSITMSGFEFLANGLRADGLPSQTVVSVYAAGADSLPMGAPLTTQTISLDTNSVTFTDIYNAHTFTPIILTTGFVVTVEAGTPIDSVLVWTGGVLSGSFDGYPTSYLSNGTWARPQASDQIGGVIPRFHPIISYDAVNTLAASITKLTGPTDVVTFTSTSPAIGSSVLAFTGLLQDDNTTALNFGDGSGVLNASTSEDHTYSVFTDDFTVTLTDSIQLYQSNVGFCVITETVLIEKAWTVGINDVSGAEITAYVSNDVIRVENAEGLATVYSITGQVVLQAFVSGTNSTIDISGLQGGIYILSVNDKAIKLKF